MASSSSQEQPSRYAVLQANDVIQGSKDSYTIEGKLGEGLTSIVYKTKDKSGEPVALKILRPGANALSVENYWSEGIILNTLRDHKITCVPQVYEVHREAPPYFIAMEFVNPKQYPSVDVIIERDGYLPEADALEFGILSLEMLQRLHTRVERTYTDMQLKNFCWDGKKKRIMVMDWNHVSYQRKDIEQGIKSRSEAVLTQLERRGADDFDGLVRLDLERFETFFYMVATGKAAMEKGETTWTLATRAGEKRWHELSVATQQVIITALVPQPELDRFSTIAEFLKALREAQALLRNNDYESLRDEAGDAIDKFEELRTKDADKQEWQEVLKVNREIQIEYDRALAVLDRIAVVKDSLKDEDTKDALARWLQHQDERLKKSKGLVSAAWGIGQRYYDDGQYATACTYMAPEAKRQGHVDLWRRYMVAAGLAELSKQGHKQELIDSTRSRLETALNSFKKDDLQNSLIDFQSALHGLGHIPESLKHLNDEIQSLNCIEKAKVRVANADELKSSLQECISLVKDVPYASILARDPFWHRVLEDWINADKDAMESYHRSGMVDVPFLINKAIRGIEQAHERSRYMEINVEGLEPILNKLESKPFLTREDFNELENFLYNSLVNPFIKQRCLKFIVETSNYPVAIGVLNALMAWTDISTDERNELIEQRFIHWLEEAVRNKNWQLAALFADPLKRKGQESHQVYVNFVSKLEEYTAEVGKHSREALENLKIAELLADFLASVDKFLSIRIQEKHFKEELQLRKNVVLEDYDPLINAYSSEIKKYKEKFSKDLDREEVYQKIIQKLEENQRCWSEERNKNPYKLLSRSNVSSALWVWGTVATIATIGFMLFAGLFATGKIPPLLTAKNTRIASLVTPTHPTSTPLYTLELTQTESALTPLTPSTPAIPSAMPAANTPIPPALPQGLSFADRHDVCPYAKDKDGKVIYFDLPPLQISPPQDWQLLPQSDGGLMIQQISNQANQGNVFVLLNDIPVTGDGKFVLGSALLDESGHQCVAPENDSKTVFWLPAPYLTRDVYNLNGNLGYSSVNCVSTSMESRCGIPPKPDTYELKITNSLGEIAEKPITIVVSGIVKPEQLDANLKDTSLVGYSPKVLWTWPMVDTHYACIQKCDDIEILFQVQNGSHLYAAVRVSGYRGWYWAPTEQGLPNGLMLNSSLTSFLTKFFSGELPAGILQ